MSFDGTVSASSIRLGEEFELDPGAFELRKAGQPLRLGRIPMELLLFLVEQRGQLVNRDQIVERIWGRNVFLDTDNSINAAIRKIRQVFEDDHEQPRFVQTVIGRGYRFIAPIVEVSSRATTFARGVNGTRFPAGPAEAFAETLTGFHSGGSVASTRNVVLIALLLVLVATLWSLKTGSVRKLLFPDAAASNATTTARIRPAVAVLGFKNLSGKDDEAWISTALSELLSADLAAGQQLRLIPGETIARMKSDLILPATDTYSPETLTKIRSNLNNDLVIVGSYLAAGKSAGLRVRLTLQVQDVRTGETVAAVSEDGTELELAELISRSGESLRRTLHFGTLSADATMQVRAALPSDPKAARFYSEGLEKLRTFDSIGARDLFLQAVSTDSNHALSHAALSECWSRLGYDLKAQQEAKKAYDLSAKLPREHQFWVEGRYRVAMHEWPRAVEVYRMLWEFFPDNLDYGVELANVQTAAGLGKDAMATVTALRKSGPLAEHDARVDLAEATAADLAGDLHQEEAAASRAAEKGRSQGAHMLLAKALLIRGSALSSLGDNANGISLLKEAQPMFAAVGDKRDVARVFANLGIIARRQSNLAEAQRLFEEALSISTETGSKAGMQQALLNLGNVLWDEGDVPRTLKAYERSLELARETGDKDRQALAYNNIAGILTMQGKLAEASKMNDTALQLFREVGDQQSIGMILGNVAELLLRQGALTEARSQAEAALAIDRQVGDKSMEGWALYELASILVLQGDVSNGRNRHQEAASLRRTLGEKVTEGENQLEIAQLQLEGGDAKRAESEARRLTVVFHEGGSTDDEALSESLVAMALLAQGKTAEAQQACARAGVLLPRVLDLVTRIQVNIVGAYVAGSTHRSHDAMIDEIRALERTRSETSRLGYVGLEMEARLRQGMLELRSGREGPGRARLEQLRKDAQSKGYLLIARRAAAATVPVPPDSGATMI